MAVELIRAVWCDGCLREASIQIPAEWSQTISIGSGSWEVDLCTDHRKALVDPLAKVLEAARPPIPDLDDDLPHACPLCTPRKAYKYRSGLNGHYRHKHPGETMPPPEGGDRRGMNSRTEKPPKTCPVCGRVCVGGLGLASHMRFNHPEVRADSRVDRPVRERKQVRKPKGGDREVPIGQMRIGDGV